MKRILDSDGEVTEIFHYDHANGRAGVQVVQDVSACLKRNEDALSLADKSWKGDLHEVAAIPRVIVEQWYQELGSNPFSKENRPWLLSRLNNRDWAQLRTKEGRL